MDRKSVLKSGQTVHQFPLKGEWGNGFKSCGKSLNESGQMDSSDSTVDRSGRCLMFETLMNNFGKMNSLNYLVIKRELV